MISVPPRFTPTSLIHVYVLSGGLSGGEKRAVGRLALKDRRIFFEYHPDFLQRNLNLSPLKLPLKQGIIASEDPLFDGLFGVFNDSLPDGWGRLLLDRKLMTLGILPGSLSPLDRLRYVGSRGMGALCYEPEIEGTALPPLDTLDVIADETIRIQEQDEDRYLDTLLACDGGSSGARPKIIANVEGAEWLIKFRSSLDPQDIGPIEYAYHNMAKQARLDLPEARLFPSQKGPGYFGVQRFDRRDGSRLHLLTASGLLHADHRIPSLDYETLMKATLWLTKDIRACETQFRAAVFNLLAHNRDDHAKNFSFLMDAHGRWHVSPAYDLTFASGPAGEHCTTLLGEGRQPTRSLLLKLAALSGISTPRATEIIEEGRCAVENWERHAQDAGVSRASMLRIRAALDAIGKGL